MTRTRGVLGPETLSHLRWIDLPYGNVIRPNAAHGVNFRVRLTGNATIEPPVNGAPGQTITLYVEQDGTGGRTVTLHSGWATAGTISVPTTASSVTVLEAVYTGSEWRIWQPVRPSTEAFPVSSVMFTTVVTSPATLLGYGSWTEIGNGNITIGGGTINVRAWERTA